MCVGIGEGEGQRAGEGADGSGRPFVFWHCRKRKEGRGVIGAGREFTDGGRGKTFILWPCSKRKEGKQGKGKGLGMFLSGEERYGEGRGED